MNGTDPHAFPEVIGALEIDTETQQVAPVGHLEILDLSAVRHENRLELRLASETCVEGVDDACRVWCDHLALQLPYQAVVLAR